MQFSKPMIELVFEIRRFVTSDLKPTIKLANPELFSELQRFYHTSANAVTKALIKELFHLAGNPWPNRLSTGEASPKQIVKVYRGQVQLQDKITTADQHLDDITKKRQQRIYRGQVVQS